ncbi:hypothetical protein [Nonomuraea salmonea]|uniref:Uncharacterized protein n=1 Tax=Nonomuraea salmonea TaxID=46181 RepID=A0ABV5P3V9_9ACTN
MTIVLCEAHTPALQAAGKSGAHLETADCVWPHEVTPPGPIPSLGHPLRVTD